MFHVVTNLKVLGEVFDQLRRGGLRALMFPLLLLFVFLLPVRIFVRILAFPCDFWTFISDARRERLAYRIESEGNNLYPLW